LTAPVIVLAVVATGLQVCIVSYAVLRVTLTNSEQNLADIIILITALKPNKFFLPDRFWIVIFASSFCVLRHRAEIKRPGIKIRI
jgi:glycerol-3-phosphate acyltransferase PlsY